MTLTRTVQTTAPSPSPTGWPGSGSTPRMARMFGLSRTRAAELIARRARRTSTAPRPPRATGCAPGRCSRSPSRPRPTRSRSCPRWSRASGSSTTTTSIVVIDKPVGVAVHPSPGWTGPTVVGHLAAAGFRIATSGASERQGIVQRLDVGTSGVMVICKSEHAYSVLKNAFRHRTVDKTYHALVQGHPDPLQGTIDAPIGRHPRADYKFAVMADGRPSVTHYETLEAHRFASPARGAPRDRPHPPDPGAHGRPEAPVRGRPHLRRRPHPRRSGWGCSGSGCTPCGSGSSTPTPASTSSTRRAYPDDLARALTALRDAV